MPKPRNPSKALGKKPVGGGARPRPPNSKPRYGPAEPRTLEGRARKKILMGLENGFGCVLAYQEMLLVVKELPEGWLKKEIL